MDITIQGVNGHLKKQNKDSISISSKNKENLLLPDIGKLLECSLRIVREQLKGKVREQL